MVFSCWAQRENIWPGHDNVKKSSFQKWRCIKSCSNKDHYIWSSCLFSPAYLSLCCAQHLACNATQLPQGTFYSVSKMKATECPYSWMNSTVSSTAALPANLCFYVKKIEAWKAQVQIIILKQIVWLVFGHVSAVSYTCVWHAKYTWKEEFLNYKHLMSLIYCRHCHYYWNL